MISRLSIIKREIRGRDPESRSVRKRSKMYVGLIDVVFGVVVALSFERIPEVSRVPLSFAGASLAIAYGMVVASWVGFHTSIRAEPHKTWFRFAIDLLLVVDYFVMVNYSSVPGIVFSAYFAMFSLYILWDTLKWVEYQKDLTKTVVRELYPLAAALLLLWIWLAGCWSAPPPGVYPEEVLYACLGGIVLLRILYRIEPLAFLWGNQRPYPARPESRWY